MPVKQYPLICLCPYAQILLLVFLSEISSHKYKRSIRFTSCNTTQLLSTSVIHIPTHTQAHAGKCRETTKLLGRKNTQKKPILKWTLQIILFLLKLITESSYTLVDQSPKLAEIYTLNQLEKHKVGTNCNPKHYLHCNYYDINHSAPPVNQ